MANQQTPWAILDCGSIANEREKEHRDSFNAANYFDEDAADGYRSDFDKSQPTVRQPMNQR